MQLSEVPRPIAAATSITSALGPTVDDAIVLHDSNKLALRLLRCDVLARAAPVAHQVAQFEVDLAVEPRVYEHDGFVVTLWTYYEPLSPREVSPGDYANALERLHAGMRSIDIAAPHFTDPDRQRAARELLNALREGPPYPALDAVMRADHV